MDLVILPKNRSVELVETLLEIIKRTLESGDDLMISGFGKFSVKEKKTRKGRNPSTGKDKLLDDRRVVTFTLPFFWRHGIILRNTSGSREWDLKLLEFFLETIQDGAEIKMNTGDAQCTCIAF